MASKDCGCTGRSVSAPGPGVTLPPPGQMGAVRIESSCAPRAVLGHVAFRLRCGGTIVNDTQHQVIFMASLASGQTGAETNRPTQVLKPGQRVVLPDPPTGDEWVVADMTRGQALRWAWGTVLVIVATGVTATYGGYAMTRDLIHRHQAKKRRQRVQHALKQFFGD